MGSKIAEVRVRMSVVYIAACSVAIPLMFLLLAVADALQPGRQDFHLLDIAIALILFVPLGAVHELLHGLAAIVYGGLHPQDLRIRVVWRAGALACHIKVPISVRTARVVGLTPFAVTVPLALGLLLWHPSTVMAVLLHFTIFGCSMDLFMVYHLRRVRRRLAGRGSPLRARLRYLCAGEYDAGTAVFHASPVQAPEELLPTAARVMIEAVSDCRVRDRAQSCR